MIIRVFQKFILIFLRISFIFLIYIKSFLVL